ncbi:SDR family oxidoreductase [Roseococcus sp. DSY-14]|uniref:SDR family oxidoreductase n=1 Tax=Roseococcus sp. DSY-14 TaxID=3369650 RepID=UPI00387B5BDB
MPGILVTGGARRIGAAISRHLAQAGLPVVIHHHTGGDDAAALAAEIAAAGGQAWTLGADLSDAAAAAALPARAGALCGGLHGLVNNASLFLYDTPSAFQAAQFARQAAVNLLAPALLTQGFAAQLPEGAEGAVVNLLDNRLWAPNPDYFTYALGKYGLAGMTEMAALHFAPRIRVNGVAPAITLVSGEQSAANFERAHRNNPLGAGVEPQDVAEAVLFLLRARRVTGEVIVVDAGQKLRRRGRDVAFPA